MNYNILGYGIYFIVILLVILQVGNVLFKNGRLFCINSFHGNVRLADTINRMLLTGYHLVNIGYSVFILIIQEEISDTKQLMEILASKLGMLILALGILHFINVIVLTGIGKKKKQSIWRKIKFDILLCKLLLHLNICMIITLSIEILKHLIYS